MSDDTSAADGADDTPSTSASTGDAPADVAVDDARELIAENLRTDIGDDLVAHHIIPNVDMWVRVTAQAWPTALAALRQRGFDYFDFLSAIDWMASPFGKGEDDPFADDTDPADVTADGDTPISGQLQGVTGGDTRFQLFARLTNLDTHLGITVKADVPESLSMPTAIGVFAGANWHEREAHEMFGIDFAGHPDLRNLYLPTGFEGYPLRKDFPLLSRHIKPWPGIVDVEAMPELEQAGQDES